MRVFIVILFFMLTYLQYQLWVGDGGLRDREQLKSDIQGQTQQNAKIKAKNDSLIEDINALTHSEDAIEEIARNKIGMIGESEVFYLIPEESAKRQKSGDN